MNERELFEDNYKWNYPNAELNWCEVTKSYTDPTEMRCWTMFQASANREGYKIVPLEPSEKQWSGLARHLGRYMQMHDRYCPKTLKKYFDRFIGEPPEWLAKEVGNWDSDHAFATADLPVFIYKAMIGAVDDKTT